LKYIEKIINPQLKFPKNTFDIIMVQINSVKLSGIVVSNMEKICSGKLSKDLLFRGLPTDDELFIGKTSLLNNNDVSLRITDNLRNPSNEQALSTLQKRAPFVQTGGLLH